MENKNFERMEKFNVINPEMRQRIRKDIAGQEGPTSLDYFVGILGKLNELAHTIEQYETKFDDANEMALSKSIEVENLLPHTEKFMEEEKKRYFKSIEANKVNPTNKPMTIIEFQQNLDKDITNLRNLTNLSVKKHRELITINNETESKIKEFLALYAEVASCEPMGEKVPSAIFTELEFSHLKFQAIATSQDKRIESTGNSINGTTGSHNNAIRVVNNYEAFLESQRPVESGRTAK